MFRSTYRIRYELFQGVQLIREIDSEEVTIDHDHFHDDVMQPAIQKGKQVILARCEKIKLEKGQSTTFNGTFICTQ